jgi:hypothetical protein
MSNRVFRRFNTYGIYAIGVAVGFVIIYAVVSI